MIPAAPSMNSRRALLATVAKLSYAFGTGALCVWLASFMPAEGPPIAAFIPANAAAALQVRDGGMLLLEIPGSRVFQEFLNDPDVETLYGLKARREKLLERYAKLPWLARWIFPPQIESLLPVLGRDWAVVSVPEDADAENGSGNSRGKPLLAYMRLSGARGLLVRLGARFAPLPKQVRLFDLGGGLIAAGLDGASPAPSPQLGTGTNAPHSPLPLARLTLRPPAFRSIERKGLSVRISPQLDQLRADGVPEAVLKSLLHPPALPELFGAQTLPARVTVDFSRGESGAFVARGSIDGDLPQPAISPRKSGVKVFDELFLPVDVAACWLRYLEGEMRLQGATPALSKGQRRWSRRLFNLEEREVDLQRDLWPAFGGALYLTVEDPPDDINTVAYGVIKACIPFDGKNERARRAAGELAREKWEDLLDGPAPKSVKPPFVRRVKGEKFERYVLMTGQINAPAWTLAENLFCFVSDAGPFAVRDASGEPPEPPWNAAPAPAYFVRLDGPRSARTAEAMADVWFAAKEDALGAHEFLEQYPNAELSIKFVKKLTRLLGTFSLEIKPDAQRHSAVIAAAWTPGTLAAPDEKQNEDVPAPPPAN